MDVRSLQVDNDMEFPGVTCALAVAAFGRQHSGAKFLGKLSPFSFYNSETVINELRHPINDLPTVSRACVTRPN